MANDFSQFELRKQDHIELALMADNQASEMNCFDSISLLHEALPDLNFDSIDISGVRLGKAVLKPFLVSSMTAGHKHSANINQHLMAACAEMEWTMGVGSQRRELSDVSAATEWHQLRQSFPNVCLLSNLGIAQVITATRSDIQRLLDGLQASALIVHCNPLQECIQPEGTLDFKGGLKAIEHLVQVLDVPVIVKETGCGFSTPTLKKLNEIGVAAVDVSGLGGTHWGRIEGHRAAHDTVRQSTAKTFRNWGVSTVQSVQSAVAIKPSYEVWGSGGVRHGLDAAKLFALGATTVGFAKPMLQAALHSKKDVIDVMKTIEYELKVAMFCTGSQNLKELKEKVCC